MFKFTSPIGKAGITAQQTDHYDNNCANNTVFADQNQMLLQADTSRYGLKTRMKQPHQGAGAATRTNSNRWDCGTFSSAIR